MTEALSVPLELTGVAGGTQNARQWDRGCPGFITAEPTVLLHVSGEQRLMLSVSAEPDTTLVIRGADGTLTCDNDSAGDNDPRVAAVFGPGDHQVWVGTLESGTTTPYALTVSSRASGESLVPGGPFTGQATLENRTSAAVCRIEATGVDAALDVPAGGTGTFTATAEIRQLWVIGCDGSVLFGSPPRSATTQGSAALGGPLMEGTIVLASSAMPAEAGRRVLVAEPMSATAWLAGLASAFRAADDMNTRAARRDAFEALTRGAAEQRYVETFGALRLISRDWEVVRHRVTNEALGRNMSGLAIARFPDGHCQVTPVTFSQAAEGRGFSSRTTFSGIGGNIYVPCAMMEAAASDPAWAR